jgi:pimeloyl-ACP methyl ester carboxylesterase
MRRRSLRFAFLLPPALTFVATVSAAIGASASTATASGPANIVSAPTRLAHTTDGEVGYRIVGSGSTLLLITGFSASMDDWAPSFITDLATHHRVIVLDNAGVGQTAAVSPSTITAMANQTSALISALHLHRTAVLGWSMGGMIAQALAVDHPTQVSHLVLAATQAGTGKSIPVPAAAAAAVNSSGPAGPLSVLFPADQSGALRAYVTGILRYTGFYQANATTKVAQNLAIAQWFAGQDPAALEVGKLKIPTLVADGTSDELDPSSNDRLLAHTIPHAKLILYPGAGHAFLFQDASQFVAAVDKFLG